jgi:hypothetical protein
VTKTVNVLPTGSTGTAVPVEFGQVIRSVPSQANDEELLERMDWQPGGEDHFFVRYFYQKDPFIFGGGSPPPATGSTCPTPLTPSARTGAAPCPSPS